MMMMLLKSTGGRCAGSAACESSQSISHCNAQNCSRKQQQSLLLYAVIVPHVAAIFGLNLFWNICNSPGLTFESLEWERDFVFFSNSSVMHVSIWTRRFRVAAAVTSTSSFVHHQVPVTPPVWETLFADPTLPLHIDIGCGMYITCWTDSVVFFSCKCVETETTTMLWKLLLLLLCFCHWMDACECLYSFSSSKHACGGALLVHQCIFSEAHSCLSPPCSLGFIPWGSVAVFLLHEKKCLIMQQGVCLWAQVYFRLVSQQQLAGADINW